MMAVLEVTEIRLNHLRLNKNQERAGPANRTRAYPLESSRGSLASY